MKRERYRFKICISRLRRHLTSRRQATEPSVCEAMGQNTQYATRLATSPAANAYVRQFRASKSDGAVRRREKWTTGSIFPESGLGQTGQQARSLSRSDNSRDLSRELVGAQALRVGCERVQSGPKPGQQGQSFPRSRDEWNMLSKPGGKERACCQLTPKVGRHE